MEVSKRNFPEVMLDNDEIFIDKLLGIIEATDELSSVEISKDNFCYHFRVAPSTYPYLEPILQEVLKFVNMFGVKLELSKSMKASLTINFSIDLETN